MIGGVVVLVFVVVNGIGVVFILVVLMVISCVIVDCVGIIV